MQKWFDAAKNSRAMQGIKEIYTTGKVKGRDSKGNLSTYNVDRNYVRYLQRTPEVFARSYAQYIAIRSGNEALMTQLRTARKRNEAGIGYQTVWDDDDFVPIAAAFDDLFKEKGWTK